MEKVAPSHGKLVVTNTRWFVQTKQGLPNMLAKSWREIEIVSTLADYLIQLPCVTNSFDV